MDDGGVEDREDGWDGRDYPLPMRPLIGPLRIPPNAASVHSLDLGTAQTPFSKALIIPYDGRPNITYQFNAGFNLLNSRGLNVMARDSSCLMDGFRPLFHVPDTPKCRDLQ